MSSLPKRLLLVSLILVVLRAGLLGVPVLTDPSEARFANAAWRMLERQGWFESEIFSPKGEWEPYLSKPPFFPMVVAGFFKVFGVHESVARFPSFLAFIGTALLVWFFAKRYRPESAPFGTLLFLSMPAAFLFFPSVITDGLLSFFVTGALVCLYQGITGNKKSGWSIGGYLCVAGGVLMKGPIGAVLPLGVIFIWLLWERRWEALPRALCPKGIALCIAVVLPLYGVAELRSPGFLSYFIFQENMGRFLFQDFGIRFGSTHRHWYGTIALFALLVSLPWSALLLTLMWKEKRGPALAHLKCDSHTRFLVSWILFPILFFLFARQILPTYVFPILPAVAMLSAQGLRALGWEVYAQKGVFLCICASIFALISVQYFDITRTSAHDVAQALIRKEVSCERIRAHLKVPHSMTFYLRNESLKFSIALDGAELLDTPDDCILVGKKAFQRDIESRVPPEWKVHGFGKEVLIEKSPRATPLEAIPPD